jgi:hypothetical protein
MGKYGWRFKDPGLLKYFWMGNTVGAFKIQDSCSYDVIKQMATLIFHWN